jgi:hypothetical protein
MRPMQLLGFGAKLLLLYAVTISAQVIVAPTPPQPSAATDVVGFIFQNPTNQSLPAQHIFFGHPFSIGQLRTASPSIVVQATGSATIPVQISVKATHLDGSVKHAVLVAQQPSIAADASLNLMLTTNSASGVGSTVDLNNFPSSSVTVSMAITQPSTQNFNVDVSQALKDALSSNSISYFFQGPLATQGRVILPVVSSFRLALDITLFSDNSYSVDIQYLNDIAMSTTGGTLAYSTTITANGQTVKSVSDLTHYQYQTWHHVYYSNQEPLVNVQFDVLGFIQSNAIPPYNYTRGINQGVVTNAINGMNSETWGQPFDNYGVTKYMPGTGGRADIGPLPLFTAAWIISQNDNLRQYMLGWGEAAGSTPLNYFAKNESRWLNVFDYPKLWLDGRCNPYSVCPTQFSEESSWSLDTAHLPNMAFVPYMITGRRYYLDRMEAVAAWVASTTWDALRRAGGEVEMGLLYGEQLRGAAWGLREVVYASYISPDDTAMRTYYDKMLFNHLSYINNQTDLWKSQTGETYGIMLAFSYGGDFIVPPWQTDFFASTISQASRQGHSLAKEFLKWSKNWDVGRFTNDPPFNKQNGIAYNLWYGDENGFVTTWARFQQEQEDRGYNNVDFAGSNGYYGALGHMTLVMHTIEDSSDADTIEAFNWLSTAGAPYTTDNDFRNDPTFGMAPYKMRVNSPSSVVAGTPAATPGATSLGVRLNGMLALLILANIIAML